MLSLDLIIFKYLSKKVLFSALVFFIVLSLIIFSNQFFIVLNQSLKQGLYNSELLPLMLLKYSRDFHIVLGLSFILGLVYALNKFYKNSEIIILTGCGIDDLKIAKILMPVIISASIIISTFSISISPYVKSQIEIYASNAERRPEFIFLREGRFQNFKNNSITFYSSEISNIDNSPNQNLKDIFVYSDENDRLILANSGTKVINKTNGEVLLNLYDGTIYQDLIDTKKSVTSITNFEKFRIKLFSESSSKEIAKIDNLSEYKRISDLIFSKNYKDTSELLNRFSFPLSIFIISILGIYVSRNNPRNKKNFSLGYALIIFITYYNMLIFLKNTSTSENLIINFMLPHIIFLSLIYFFFLLSNNLKFNN